MNVCFNTLCAGFTPQGLANMAWAYTKAGMVGGLCARTSNASCGSGLAMHVYLRVHICVLEARKSQHNSSGL